MIHVAALAGAIIWFGLNGLLWYMRPSDLLWLLGSAILGVIFFAGFFVYLRWSNQGTAKCQPQPWRVGNVRLSRAQRRGQEVAEDKRRVCLPFCAWRHKKNLHASGRRQQRRAVPLSPVVLAW
jgi:hypothetical protein